MAKAFADAAQLKKMWEKFAKQKEAKELKSSFSESLNSSLSMESNASVFNPEEPELESALDIVQNEGDIEPVMEDIPNQDEVNVSSNEPVEVVERNSLLTEQPRIETRKTKPKPRKVKAKPSRYFSAWLLKQLSKRV